jgi:peroxiredoxin
LKRPFAISVFILVAALIVFNLLLVRQNGYLQARLKGPSRPFNNSTDNTWLRLTSANSPICQLTLQKKGEQSYQPGLTLLVFLGQQDCGACLEEAEVWEKLYKKFSSKGFFVLGVIRQADTLWADQLSKDKDYELTFPIASLDSTTLEYLGLPPVTPFKMMVDSLRRVVYFSGPNSEPGEQKNFAEVAEKLCRAYLGL